MVKTNNNNIDFLLEALGFHWAVKGIKSAKTCSKEAVEISEKHLHIKFPLEFKKYLYSQNGMEDYEVDQDLYSFFTLHRITNECITLHTHNMKFICFAETFLGLQLFFIEVNSKNNLGKVLVTGNHLKIFYESFSHFLNEYIFNEKPIA